TVGASPALPIGIGERRDLFECRFHRPAHKPVRYTPYMSLTWSSCKMSHDGRKCYITNRTPWASVFGRIWEIITGLSLIVRTPRRYPSRAASAQSTVRIAGQSPENFPPARVRASRTEFPAQDSVRSD